MYWADRGDETFEVIDGQQRTISICQYVNGDFAHVMRFFNNLQDDEQAYTRQNGVCKICGNHFELEEMETNHMTPWSQGGKTNLENCQMLCRDCNRRKSDK